MVLNRRSLLISVPVVFCAPAILRAAESPLELNLLLDASGSMYRQQVPLLKFAVPLDLHQRQRNGHIEALLSPEVSQLLIWQRATVRVFLWSDIIVQLCQPVSIQSRKDVEFIAHEIERLAQIVPLADAGTLHYRALEYFADAPPQGVRRVIDISTNEQPNQKDFAKCQKIRDTIFNYGGTINVLAVDPSEDITSALQATVQTPNGFTEVAHGWDDYARAISEKLLGELS